MKVLRLYRKPLLSCCVGTILHGNRVIHTIEKPLIEGSQWRGGQPFYSAVPFGLYKLIPHNGKKYKDVYALVNPDLGVYRYKTERKFETDRYGILVHAANYASQLQGCIAPGQGSLYDQELKMHCVSSSKNALTEIKGFVKESGYTHLEILPYEIAC